MNDRKVKAKKKKRGKWRRQTPQRNLNILQDFIRVQETLLKKKRKENSTKFKKKKINKLNKKDKQEFKTRN